MPLLPPSLMRQSSFSSKSAKRSRVSCEGHQREKVRAGTAREAALGYKRERSGGAPLLGYISRPAIAVSRLSLSSTGKVVYSLKARGSSRPGADAR